MFKEKEREKKQQKRGSAEPEDTKTYTILFFSINAFLIIELNKERGSQKTTFSCFNTISLFNKHTMA